MPPHLSGDDSNVYVNEANLVILNDKAIYAKDAIFTGTLTADTIGLGDNLDVAGELSVAGATTLSNVAEITDTLTLSKADGTGLSVAANAAISQNLSVTGTLSSGAATLASAVVSGALSSGAATLASASVTDTLVAGGKATLNASGTGLEVANNAIITGTLNSGAATLASASVTGALSSGALATLHSASVTNNAGVGGNLTVTGTSTLNDQVTLNNSGAVALNVAQGTGYFAESLQVDGAIDLNSTADISDTLTLSKATGTGLKIDSSGALALNVPNGSASIGGSLSVGGDLNVTGSVTAVETVNLKVDDPIAEFGSNVTNTTDTGLIFTRSSGETGNVAVFYDVDETRLTLGYTADSATDKYALSTTGSLPVHIDGSLDVAGGDLVVNTSDLVVDTTNNRVGINTAAPTKALEVTGDAKVSANVYVTKIFFN
jgi:hypothetical protein